MKNALNNAVEALALAVECGGELDQKTFVAALADLKAMLSAVQSYDRSLNDRGIAPDGNNYNELLSLIGVELI